MCSINNYYTHSFQAYEDDLWVYSITNYGVSFNKSLITCYNQSHISLCYLKYCFKHLCVSVVFLLCKQIKQLLFNLTYELSTLLPLLQLNTVNIIQFLHNMLIRSLNYKYKFKFVIVSLTT